MCGNTPCQPLTDRCTWSPVYRKQCEARWVLSHYPLLSDRRNYIDRITQKRGHASAEALKENLTREWNKQERAKPKSTAPCKARGKNRAKLDGSGRQRGYGHARYP